MQDFDSTTTEEAKKAVEPTKVYLLWGMVHPIKHDVLFGVYREQSTCVEELKRQQACVNVEAIEFHVEEINLK